MTVPPCRERYLPLQGSRFVRAWPLFSCPLFLIAKTQQKKGATYGSAVILVWRRLFAHPRSLLRFLCLTRAWRPSKFPCDPDRHCDHYDNCRVLVSQPVSPCSSPRACPDCTNASHAATTGRGDRNDSPHWANVFRYPAAPYSGR